MLLNRLETWANYNPMDYSMQAIFRILYSFFCLISLIGVLRLETLTLYPSFLFSPQYGAAYLFKELPNIYILHSLNIFNLIFLIGILFGFKTKWNSILFGISFIFSTSFIYAYSKIGHQHFIPFTALIFAFSNWGNKFSIDSLNKQTTKTNFNIYPFFMLIIAFSFFTSGFSKLLGGWLDHNFQAVRFYLIRDFTFVGRSNILTNFAIYKINSKLFWEFMDYFIVLIEILPLFLLFNHKLFRYFMFLLATFHLGVYLTMNIPFGMYPLIYLPFIVDWEKSILIKKISNKLESIIFKKNKAFIVFFIVILLSSHLHYKLNFNGVNGLSLHRGVILVFSYIVVLYFFLESIYLNRLYKTYKKKAT